MYKLNGLLSDFPLPDIIQLLIITQKVGELVLSDEENRDNASLYFDKGNLLHAVHLELEGRQAFESILRWEQGSFTFIPDKQPEKVSLNQAAHVMLLQALSRMDDINKIGSQLPDSEINLFIVSNLEKVPIISTEEWRVLALVNGRRTIDRICQKHGDELKAKQLLMGLFQKGIISTEPPESDWRRLIPSLKPTSEVEGSRPLPPRVRTNLLFRTIDGKSHFEDIRRKLEISENALLEDMKLLYELQWIKFSNDDEDIFLKLIADY